jgi:hypothetical protein
MIWERRSGRIYHGEWLASVAQSHAEILVLHQGLCHAAFARIVVCNLKRWAALASKQARNSPSKHQALRTSKEIGIH